MKKKYNTAPEYKTFKYKLLIVGDSKVGKSALLHRFTDNIFIDTYVETIGVEYIEKKILINDKNILYSIIDSSGNIKYNQIVKSYYRGEHCVLILFDLTSYDSFLNVENWIKEKQRYSYELAQCIIVGTKCDLKSKIKVSKEEIELLTSKYCNITYVETSSKNDMNVKLCFNLLREKIDDEIYNKDKIVYSAEDKKSCCCCS